MFHNYYLIMKKTKTSLQSISRPQYLVLNNSRIQLDNEIESIEKKYNQNDQQILLKKNQLLQREVQQLKEGKKSLQRELQAYRKVVLKDGDIHGILDMQHEKIFELQTNLQLLQGKYDRLLNTKGSSQQTQYAIKCKQLENILKNKEIEHQKQISYLKSKMMKMNATQIVENSRLITESGKGSSLNNPNSITPIKNSRKFV